MEEPTRATDGSTSRRAIDARAVPAMPGDVHAEAENSISAGGLEAMPRIWERESITVRSVAAVQEVYAAVQEIIEEHRALLPTSTDALILIKPNLNNDLNALTGNSTDLRVLVALVKALHGRGFTNLIIGDGSNVGVHRKGISAIARLKIDRLAAQFGVQVVDLNETPGRRIFLANGQPALVSQLCFDAALFISVPTIKTHEEAQLSCACKNLVGCLAGGREKKKIHAGFRSYLAENLLALNVAVRPHLHIVDGLMAMEGRGPGDGTPRHLGILIDGTDPFLVDATVAHLVGFDPDTIPYLALAQEQGYVSLEDLQQIRALPQVVSLQKAPPRSVMTQLLGHNAFIGLRDLVRPLFDNRVVLPLLYRWGIIQDVYERGEATISLSKRDGGARCLSCTEQTCQRFCPTDLPVASLQEPFTAVDCLGCMYCFLVCPHDVLHAEGQLGYLARHLGKYHQGIVRAANAPLPGTDLTSVHLNVGHRMEQDTHL